MTTQPKPLLAEVREIFYATNEHEARRDPRPGQLTVADYYRLAAVGPDWIEPIARVLPTIGAEDIELLGVLRITNQLVRSTLRPEASMHWPAQLPPEDRREKLHGLPILRLIVSEDAPNGARLMDVPAPASHPDCDACNARRDGAQPPAN